MPGLADQQCYQVCKAIDLAPVLSVLDRLPFVGINYHLDGSDPNKPACDVVLEGKFPPELTDFIAGLGLGGRTGRAIIRRLPPQRGIPAHVDQWMPGEANWRRFQVPLVSDPAILMRWPEDGVSVHLAPGFLYEVRYDRLHDVVNPTACARVHLQIDQIDATI